MASDQIDVAGPKMQPSNRCEPGSYNIAVATFPDTSSEEPKDVDGSANELIDKFNAALAKQDTSAIADLFLDNSYWRDHLGLSWDYHTLKGKQGIQEFLDAHGKSLKKITINRSTPFRAPHFGSLAAAGNTKGIEFFIDFETERGSGQGVCRMMLDTSGAWKIFSLSTCLQQLKDLEEATYRKRPMGTSHGADRDAGNWLDRRGVESEFRGGKEPAVIIVGAGQAGLTVAARLKVLGIEALLVDKNPRIGDNWRNRYKSLVLHDPVQYDHMPLLAFPAFWPTFTPKDKLAGWFEFYAASLELNVWTNSTLKSSSWDDKRGEWTVTIDRTKSDGTKEERVFHPRHIIQATGHSGKMNMPKIKGMDDFRGSRLCHSSQFPGPDPQGAGKKAIVVGSCNSGHDIAQAFYEAGYDVTMIQRSSTCLVSSEAITGIGLKGLYDEDGPPVDDADLWLHGMPVAALKQLQINITSLQNRHDAKTMLGLEKAGFKLDTGPDAGGLFMKYFQRGGGYYIDVGASQLIIDGKIKIKQGQEIEEVTHDGLKFADGTTLQADEIVFATGYQNMRTEARNIFGDELANRIGDAWGFDEEGEMRTIWRPSGHPGFWFMGGNLALCRYYSRLLALQIKAKEAGLAK